MDLEKLKYPIGRFEFPREISPVMIKEAINAFAAFPDQLEKEVGLLNTEQLDTPYRPDGWKIRQVINHCADSHMNSLTRFKWTLTEDQPTIKAYYEDRWAKLPDSAEIEIHAALSMIEGIHKRWVHLVRALDVDQLKRTYIHPDGNREISLAQTVCQYGWHAQHHLAHITSLKNRMNW